jgi:hypothetical protein
VKKVLAGMEEEAEGGESMVEDLGLD